MTSKVKVNRALARKVLTIVDKGLCMGVGSPIPGKMCVEAAVAYASGEPHGDCPSCVHPDLRSIKIEMNDTGGWANDLSRARGMRRLAIAQLGSIGRFKLDRFQKLLPKIVLEYAAKHAPRDVFELPAFWSNFEDRTDYCSPYMLDGVLVEAFGWPADRALYEAAELCVQVLIKMRMPGTKFLNLAPFKPYRKPKTFSRPAVKRAKK